MKQVLHYIKSYAEPVIWTSALTALFFMNGGTYDHSLCLVKAMGFTWCPGCGLGHAIHDVLHFDFKASVQEHILGIPATIILFYQTIKSTYIIYKNNNYGSTKNIKYVPGY